MYKLFLIAYYIGIHIFSLWSKKAKLWIEGRENTTKKLQTIQIKNCIWFHAASLGEFEQISYLIEKLKLSNPKEKILVTFFSPSGFEAKKHFKFTDEILYLPFDFKGDIEKFITTIQPKLVFWVRYEFWFHTLHILQKKGIPLILLNGVFYPQVSLFYKSYLNKCLACFTKVYCINLNSQSNLSKLGFDSDVISDTRYDRMKQTVESKFNDEKIEHFIGDKNVIVCGSIWASDDHIIKNCILNKSDIQWILAPHEVDPHRIEELVIKFSSAKLYSNYDSNSDSNILIIDSIGLLSKIYRFASLAYVGGGFEKVVHSLIEPFAYGIPIIIGKNIEKSEEAKEFLKDDIIIQIFNSDEFNTSVNQILANNHNINNENKMKIFSERTGSSNKIMDFVQKNIDL